LICNSTKILQFIARQLAFSKKEYLAVRNIDLKISFEDDFLSYIVLNNVIRYYEYFIFHRPYTVYERICFNESLWVEYELIYNTRLRWQGFFSKKYTLFYKCLCNDLTSFRVPRALSDIDNLF